MSRFGEPWFAGLPDGWTVQRFKRMATIRNGQVDPRKPEYRDLPLYAPNHIESATGVLLGVESAAEQGADSGKYPVRAAEIVYSKIRPALRKVIVAPVDGLCSADMYALSPAAGVHARFLFWALLSEGFSEAAQLASDRVAMPKVNRDTLVDFPLPSPPLTAQKRIAAFLDRNTAAIDRLMGKKQRLLDLLAENRAALINQAVTKGLSSGVPMKDSGIPWIGEVPAHWAVMQLRRALLSMVDGPFGSSMKSTHYSDAGVRVIRLQNIGSADFRDEDYAFISADYFEKLKRHDARPGDLLIAGLGDSRHPVGRACVLPEHVPIALVKADCYRVRLDQSRLTHAFAAEYLSSAVAAAGMAVATRGSTRTRINLDIARSTLLPVPPIWEQENIVATIASTRERIKETSGRIELQIDRLQEYRQALITAAVTGQIDVTADIDTPADEEAA